MKKYPFNARKYAHDIEYRRDAVFCQLHDVENDLSADDKLVCQLARLYGDLTDILLDIKGGMDARGIVFLTGAQIGLAKETILWAGCRRCG